MKKTYVKAELKAKNAPSGSYAAGCPAYEAGAGFDRNCGSGNSMSTCKYCECSK